jgi:nicotinamidase-related amidase
MPLLESERSLVLMIDMQERLVPVIDRPEMTIEACRRMLRLADLFDVPVLVTELYRKGLGPTEGRLLETFESLATEKRLVEKSRFSCCGAEAFEAAFQELYKELGHADRQVIVVGIEAHVCVLQTTVELLDRGCAVHVCWDAVSGRGAEYRDWALDRMQQAGASVTNHESVAFEWARHREDPRFKAVNQMFREGQIMADEHD